jgi:hypothetical protein
MYPQSPRSDKWFVYLLGCLVFVGIFYFASSRLSGLSAGISLAISIPGGMVSFFVLAVVAENRESGDWDSGA